MEDYNDNNLEQNNQNLDSDSQNPENRNSEPQNTVNPNPVNPNPVNQNPGYQNPSFQNPGYQNPGFQNQGYQNPGYQNPGYQNPGFQNPGYQNPGYQNPNFHTQNFQSPPINPGILYSLRLNGWSTFVGVFAIIIGALTCLGMLLSASRMGGSSAAVLVILIGIALGILLIVAGVMIINASDAMKKFQQFRDIQKVAEAFKKLNSAFVIGGVIAIFYIIVILIAIIAGISLASQYSRYPFGY